MAERRDWHCFMRRVLVTFSTLVIIILSACVSTPTPTLQPFVEHAVWSGPSRKEVFSACLTALQLEGLPLHPVGVNVDAGLIVTQDIEFYPYPNFNLIVGDYTLQILVSELPNGEVMVDFTPRGGWHETDPQVWGYKVETVQAIVNNRVSADLDSLLARIESLLGPANRVSRGGLLKWR